MININKREISMADKGCRKDEVEKEEMKTILEFP